MVLMLVLYQWLFLCLSFLYCLLTVFMVSFDEHELVLIKCTVCSSLCLLSQPPEHRDCKYEPHAQPGYMCAAFCFYLGKISHSNEGRCKIHLINHNSQLRNHCFFQVMTIVFFFFLLEVFLFILYIQHSDTHFQLVLYITRVKRHSLVFFHIDI